MTPEKSWVKPMSSPSENVSTSAVILLRRSPVGWLSRKDRGSVWIFRIASFRRSLDTPKVILLLQTAMIHWASAATATTIPMPPMIVMTPSKRTDPAPIISSIAFPQKTGTIRETATLTAAQTKLITIKGE